MKDKEMIGAIATAVLLALLILTVVTLTLSWEVKKMKQAIADLVTAVNANTAAINAAIAAGFVDPADVTAIQAATATLAQSTAALVAATPKPVTPVP